MRAPETVSVFFSVLTDTSFTRVLSHWSHEGYILDKERPLKTLFFPAVFLFLLISLLFLQKPLADATAQGTVRLENHVPENAMRGAIHMGRMAGEAKVSMTVSLNLRNQAQLEILIGRLHDPHDSMYGKFLSTSQFNMNYASAEEDKAAVLQYLVSHKLEPMKMSSNTVQFRGSVSDIEKAFSIEMHQYQSTDGRQVYAPNINPAVDSAIASKISGILGLNNFTKFVSHRKLKKLSSVSNAIGSGPNGGMSPTDIQKAYAFDKTSANGTGQNLALMELDGYKPSDISTYSGQFGLKTPPSLQNILIGGYDGSAGDGSDEVTLDIELMMAVAPGASQILVYEGPNSETGPIDVYTKIADDNIAKQVSSSWGSWEAGNTPAFLNSENAIFMQMAAQGQSIYAAAGDSGAYDDGKTLSVDDPASQPYVVAAGGTTLAVNTDGSYLSESSWGTKASGKRDASGGGGGISGVWPIPSWQVGIVTTSNKGSSTNRMVPDISMNANPNTGYAIYSGGSWGVFGGTSCVAPLLAGFTALINQQRASGGAAPLGFANLEIYNAAKSSSYASLFHDVLNSTDNLFYLAIEGFDLATGWGSPNIPSLLSVLSALGLPVANNPIVALPPTPTDFSVVVPGNSLINGGLQ